jgi:hypothetical protein
VGLGGGGSVEIWAVGEKYWDGWMKEEWGEFE